MEILSPDEPSFVNDVYLTDTGEKEGKVLSGEWLNFHDALNGIGSRTLAIDGTEYIQVSGQSVRISLEFRGMDRELSERIAEAGRQKPLRIGVTRRYVLNLGPTGHDLGSQDVLWEFGSVQDFVATFRLRGEHELLLSFSAKLDDIREGVRLGPDGLAVSR